MCWGWEFIIFDEKNIFLGPQGPTGTILVPVEIELVPRFGLPSSPRSIVDLYGQCRKELTFENFSLS